MINSTMQSMFDDVKLLNDATIDVRVEMNPSKLAEKLATEIHKDMDRISYLAGVKDLDIEPDGILKYLKTLTFMRVSLVSDSPSKAFNSYKPLARHLAVPVMFYQCLISMGVAIDRDFALRFYPVYSIDSTDLLSPDDMKIISDKMARVERGGLKLVYGIPRERDGELDFMALSHVEEQVKGYRRSHPVYGFLAAFFAQKQLSEVTGAMCRVHYGFGSDYSMYVAQLYSELSK